MKQNDRIKRGAHTITALLLAAGLVACGERITETSKAPDSSPASPSAVVIGQSPAAPTGDPAGTSPVAGNTSDVTTAEENRSKPQEGDSDSHSTLDPKSPMKANGTDPVQERSRP